MSDTDRPGSKPAADGFSLVPASGPRPSAGTGLVRRDADVLEDITATQVLEPGYYWTAKVDIEKVAMTGQSVLLLELNLDHEKRLHSITVLQHPSYGEKTHTMLVDDFLAKFEPAADADTERAREQQAVLDEVARLQTEMNATLANPQAMMLAIEEDVEERFKREEYQRKEAAEREVREARQRKDNLDKIHRRAARRSEAAGNPLVEARIGTGTSVSSLIGSGINDAGVERLAEEAGRQAIVAEVQGRWLKERTEEITNTLKRLAPYAAEKSKLALARSSGALARVEALRRGIESLDLYTGKGVDVFDIRAGKDAPTSEPLMLVQGKRFMNEELAVFMDLSEDFDFSSQPLFFGALKDNPALVDQIFPGERCVVSMAVRRDAIDYGKMNAFEAASRNEANQRVFLLVRNGQNVHVVYSATPSHEASRRLFPTHDEVGNLFTGLDGSRMTLADVDYAQAVKDHDNLALHYKRFLILLCGLDHRMRLLGEFYPSEQALNFMTAEFQERYMRFYADDEMDNLLVDKAREPLPSVDDFIERNNKLVQSGSRVFITNPELVKLDEGKLRRGSQVLRLAKSAIGGEYLVQREGTRFYVSLPTNEHRGFSASPTGLGPDVQAWLEDREELTDRPWWLCVDAVKADELAHYVASRRHRAMGANYIRLFRRVEAHLRSIEKAEAPARAYLLEAATTHGGMSEEIARPAIDLAVRTWRAAHRGAPLPGADDVTELNEILKLVAPPGWLPPAHEKLVEQYVEQLMPPEDGSIVEPTGDPEVPAPPAGTTTRDWLGCKPLALVRVGNGKYALYTTPRAIDKAPYPDVLDFRWVRRVVLEPSKTGRSLRATSDTLVWLREQIPAAETEIRRWGVAPGVDGQPDSPGHLADWLNKDAEPIRLRKYAQLKQNMADAARDWGDLMLAGPGGGIRADRFEALLEASRKRHRQNEKLDASAQFFVVPLALYRQTGQERDKLHAVYAMINMDRFLYWFGNQEQKDTVREMLTSRYSWYRRMPRRLEEYLGYVDYYGERVADPCPRWRIAVTAEDIDLKHDAPVSHIRGRITEHHNHAIDWLQIYMEQNRKRQKGKKLGRSGPFTSGSYVQLSPNGAFAELAGVGRKLRAKHFRHVAERIRDLEAADPLPAPAGHQPLRERAGS